MRKDIREVGLDRRVGRSSECFGSSRHGNPLNWQNDVGQIQCSIRARNRAGSRIRLGTPTQTTKPELISSTHKGVRFEFI